MMRAMILISFLPCFAVAGQVSDNEVFVQALINGTARQPLPDRPAFDRVVRELQQQTGDAGPIMVNAVRITLFAQQTRCGRVAFVLAQPSSHHAWPTMGGQLNLCEDGLPPWQQCPATPGVLVPPNSTCADHSAPEDTAEVKEAIRAALAAGGLSKEQVRNSLTASSAPPKTDIRKNGAGQ